MPIQRIVLNSLDVPGSVAFYTQLLGLREQSTAGSSTAVLDALTAQIEIRPTPPPVEASTFVPDNLQRGFRHIGFKVTDLDRRAHALKEAGTPFLFEPMNIGNLRVCFFFDPDGTLVEFVEGALQYTTVYSQEQVDEEHAMAAPVRPRFDHVAITVDDRDTSSAFYVENFGFTRLGLIDPPIDMDGFSIGYLRSGPTVIELFTFNKPLSNREPQHHSPGFAHLEFPRPTLGNAAGLAANTPQINNDQFTFTIAPAGPVGAGASATVSATQ